MPTLPRRSKTHRRRTTPQREDAATLIRQLVRDEFRRCVMRAAAEVDRQRAAKRRGRRTRPSGSRR